MLTFARQQQRRNLRWLLSLSLLVLLATLLSLCAGEQWIAPGDWLSARGELFVWQIRLPRTLAVLLVGAALALSGAVMQALFENPLAEPGLLGVSNGAGVGLIAAVLLGQGNCRMVAGAVRHSRRAHYYVNSAAFCAPPSLYQPLAVGGRRAGYYL